MRDLTNYITFCKKFHKYYLPKLKIKELNDRYSRLYRELYEIDKDDVNKASFIVFISTFTILVLFSIVVLNLSILIIFLYSAIFSFMISYRFNLILYHDINKKEAEINALLYLIKIDFS